MKEDKFLNQLTIIIIIELTSSDDDDDKMEIIRFRFFTISICGDMLLSSLIGPSLINFSREVVGDEVPDEYRNSLAVWSISND